jgi:hypothetical protein
MDAFPLAQPTRTFLPGGITSGNTIIISYQNMFCHSHFISFKNLRRFCTVSTEITVNKLPIIKINIVSWSVPVVA